MCDKPLHNSDCVWEVPENIVKVPHKVGHRRLEQQILSIAAEQQCNVDPGFLRLAERDGAGGSGGPLGHG